MSTEQDAVTEQKTDTEQPKIEAGTILKSRREELGLSQKQIADRLRLRLSIIQGIEENNFESGQVATFTRGYLRSYAKAVGLEESVVLCALDDCGSAQHKEHEMLSFSKKTKRERHDSRIMGITWGILAVMVGISSVWWWQNQQTDTLAIIDDLPEEVSVVQDESSEPGSFATITSAAEPSDDVEVVEVVPEVAAEPIVTEVAEVADTSEPEVANEVTSEAIVEESPVPAQLPEVEQVEEPESVVISTDKLLAMSFSADCWIQVKDANGKTLSTGIKKAGQNLELSGEAPFNVILGAPESVSMTFASEPVDLSGYTSGKVARFTLP
ncbi:cytoskeleton protein RodZ [Vibrio paucivorans]|uniref:Cytoskeleton protein RodZ n=1 Tax=Vibrio paucivorans TaxID=2829489 RepID=A0A9X3CFL8_9VIBR|nr:cytoskeleton protein RodZ [Vibrio paucivorans]MCW8334952.1 cytoskeleton protein RodZ [Vibrio paucivorans]